MTETVLFETEQLILPDGSHSRISPPRGGKSLYKVTSDSMSDRADVAAYFRAVAKKLESGGTVTLESGADSVTLDPPSTVEFEVKAEHEGPEGNGELSLS